MALPPSPISLAADAIAGALADHFTAHSVDAVVSVGTPAAAGEAVKGANARKRVNLFFYRLTGSGVHAATTPGQPLMLSLFCLVTAFDQPNANAAGTAELRLLGEAVRFFHSQPLLGPLPDPPAAGATRYVISAVLQQPPMEELNHIWGTQGNDTPYRLSASYEIGLVPVDPLVAETPAPPVVAASYDVRGDAPDGAPGPETAGLGRVWPLDPAAPVRWLPLALLVDGARLATRGTYPAAATELPIALAGPPGEKAAFALRFLRADGTEAGAASRQRTIQAALIDDGEARTSLAIAPPAGTATVEIEVSPVVAGGAGGLRGHRLTAELA